MIIKQDFWNNSYLDYKFRFLEEGDPNKKLIDRFVPVANNNETIFEAGCFPGRYIVEFGQKGYVLNGCDLTPRVINDLPEWLKGLGYKIGVFEQAEFNSHRELSYKFDVVCSFGFTEHFIDFRDVFLQHCEMVKDGGIVFVQFPNFYGVFQRVLHMLLDYDNYKIHVLQAMNLDNYKKIVPEGFEILFCGYFGKFDFWADDFKRKNSKLRNKIIYKINCYKKIGLYLPESKLWSPYGAIVLKKAV